MEEAFEDEAAVGAAKDGFAGALGVRHEAGDVAGGVADAGNVAEGTVGVALLGGFALGIDVLPEDLAVGFELGEG